MKGMPFSCQSEGGFVGAAASYWTSVNNSNNQSSSSSSSSKRKRQQQLLEPCSVLDSQRSPSPPTSTSALSSSLGSGGSDSAGVAALSEKWSKSTTYDKGDGDGDNKKEAEWASELQPIPASSLDDPKCVGGFDDWEAVLSETAAATVADGSPGHEQTFLRWIMGDIDEESKQPQRTTTTTIMASEPPPIEFEPFGSLIDAGFGPLEGPSAPPPPPPPPSVISMPNPTNNNKAVFLPTVPSSNNLPMCFQEPVDEKSHHLYNNNSSNLLVNQHQLHPSQSPSFFLPLQHQRDDAHLVLPPNPKRHHSSFPQSFPSPAPTAAAVNPYGIQQQRPPPKPKDEAAAAAAQQQQAVVDQLLKASEFVEAGNPFSAREILARLNHLLPPSPLGLKPLLRSAFLFKEVLALLSGNPVSMSSSTPLSNPWDVVLKLSSHKALSEVSPFIHFAHFTCTQALLEEVGASDRIHIVDFDIGVGGQWSSFMQELAHRRPQSTPFLKITAFVSPSSFHPLELHLIRDNLSHFATELNIPFEFTFIAIESVNPSELLAASANETIAVNLPVGSHYPQSFPTLLRLVKQLNPKIVVSVDQGCDRSDLPFSHHFLHSFQACMVLLDSIDAAGTNAEVAHKIERFLVQPRVKSAVLGRHRAADKMPPWRALFASMGFAPFQFSNFTETQAECLLKRVQVRGFHVEKRQASLFLYWQCGELGCVSAWKCCD